MRPSVYGVLKAATGGGGRGFWNGRRVLHNEENLTKCWLGGQTHPRHGKERGGGGIRRWKKTDCSRGGNVARGGVVKKRGKRAEKEYDAYAGKNRFLSRKGQITEKYTEEEGGGCSTWETLPLQGKGPKSFRGVCCQLGKQLLKGEGGTTRDLIGGKES